MRKEVSLTTQLEYCRTPQCSLKGLTPSAPTIFLSFGPLATRGETMQSDMVSPLGTPQVYKRG